MALLLAPRPPADAGLPRAAAGPESIAPRRVPVLSSVRCPRVCAPTGPVRGGRRGYPLIRGRPPRPAPPLPGPSAPTMPAPVAAPLPGVGAPRSGHDAPDLLPHAGPANRG